MRLADTALVIILVAAAFFIGLNIGASYRVPTVQEVVDESSISMITTKIGFTELNASIQDNTISLLGNCRLIQFDVTSDQAFSIALAITNTSSQRPLTHDIFKESLDNFGIQILQISIDRFEEEIYKATIYMRRGNVVLALDARPSDSIALAARYGLPLYMKTEILEEQGRYVC